MSVGAQEIVCPCWDAIVDVTVGSGRTAVGAGEGHAEGDGVVNQLCTACLQKIHVEVE